MLRRIALLSIAAPRRVLLAAFVVFVAAAAWGIPVFGALSSGGFQDPNSESARTSALVAEKFHRGDLPLVLAVTDPRGVLGPAASRVAADLTEGLRASPHVASIDSAWAGPGGGPAANGPLISRDGSTGLIVVGIDGDENEAQRRAADLVDQLVHDRDGVTVRAGGTAMIYADINEQNERDLLVMEAIAFPLSFVVLIWVFGGLVAAALPMLVAGMAIVGSMSVLRLLSLGTDVSIYALNLTTALGMALAIDYALLLLSRYRDELAAGETRERALVRTMTTAGRTVLFSATIVALSMAALLIFPMYFLTSFAYAGIPTVLFAAVAALVIVPSAIWLLGDRLDALDVRRLWSRGDRAPVPVERQFWYRWTKAVMRRALPLGVAISVLLVGLGLPFLGVQWGFPDDRVLPASSAAHQVGDLQRSALPVDPATAISVVLPDASGLGPADLGRYAAELSRLPDVASVSAPTGTFVAGAPAGPPSSATGIADGAALLTVASSAPLFSDASREQLSQVRKVPAPGGQTAQLTGIAAMNEDTIAAIIDRMPLVLVLIAVISVALLFLLTGSVVLPLKSLVLNVLSLSAMFGALVWFFQDGHLGALGTTATGTLAVNMPVLLFCIAFGLSMDYEVFLMARIRENWLEQRSVPGRSAREASDESVALGLARTGRVITAAALIMSISFAALIAAKVSFMRMFGVGLTLAVLADATLVRMVLVPSFMHLMGRWNWWAPGPLARWHERFGITEDGAPRDSAPEGPAAAGGTPTAGAPERAAAVAESGG